MVSTRFQPWNEVWSEMNRLQGEMNRLFGRLGNGNTSRSSVGFPALNLWEEQDSLFVEAELPGMELSDIEIYVNAGNVIYREYGIGDFQRSFAIGEVLDASQIHAELKHGVLTVHLPKTEAVKLRRIPVNSGD